MFYSVLCVKLLSTVDYQGSWHMHGCICFFSLVKALYFYVSHYWGYLFSLWHYLLVKNSGAGSVVSAQFQPHFCFSLHTITSMKSRWVKVKIVHMLGIACLLLIGNLRIIL